MSYILDVQVFSPNGVFPRFEVGKIWGTVIFQSVTVSSWFVRHDGRKLALTDSSGVCCSSVCVFDFFAERPGSG